MEPVAAAAGKVFLGKAVTEICNYLKNTIGQSIDEWRNEARIAELYTKIEHVRKVKTLWQIDDTVDLFEDDVDFLRSGRCS